MTNTKSTSIRVNKNLNKFKINNLFHNRWSDFAKIVFITLSNSKLFYTHLVNK